MDYLKSERNDSVRTGRSMLENSLNASGIKVTDKILHRIMSRYGISEDNQDELYFRIGVGIIGTDDIAGSLDRQETARSKSWMSWFRPKAKKEEPAVGESAGPEHRYVTATCCNPIPGDSVVGFRGPDGTVTVHKKSCPVANDEAAKHGDRIVVPEWEGAVPDSSFLVRLSLKGFDRLGIINEISRYISLVMNVNMRRIYLNTEDEVFDGYIDLYVHDKDDLERLIRRLGKIEGIQSVVRTDM